MTDRDFTTPAPIGPDTPPYRQRAFMRVTLPEDPNDPPLEPDAWIPEDDYDARQGAGLYAGRDRHE